MLGTFVITGDSYNNKLTFIESCNLSDIILSALYMLLFNPILHEGTESKKVK